MADQIMTAATETAAIVPELWSARWYDVLRASLPFLNSVSTEYQGEIQDMGDTVNINTMPDFDEAEVLNEGIGADADSVTISNQALLINSRVVKDAIVTKRSQLQSLPFMDKLRDAMVYSINKKMHSLIIAAVSPSTASPDHVISYDSGTTLALADILEAKELLDIQDVPLGDRSLGVGMSQLNDLFNITGFVSKDFNNGASPLMDGAFNLPVAGFAVRPSSEFGNTTYAYHSSFLTMAIQDQLNIEVFNLGVEGVRATRVNADLLFGYKQLDDKRVVTIS